MVGATRVGRWRLAPASGAELLAERVRKAVSRSSSAIVLIAAAHDVDEMLTAIGDSGADVIRQTLTEDEAAAPQASLKATPPARRSAGCWPPLCEYRGSAGHCFARQNGGSTIRSSPVAGGVSALSGQLRR
jgi:hypothetical protein